VPILHYLESVCLANATRPFAIEIFLSLLTHFGTVVAPRSITTRAALHLSAFSTLKAADHLSSTWSTFFSLIQLLLISQLFAHIFQRSTIRHQQYASVRVSTRLTTSMLFERGAAYLLITATTADATALLHPRQFTLSARVIAKFSTIFQTTRQKKCFVQVSISG
jgi:hypothetical protein